MKDLNNIISDLDHELYRAKKFLTDNKYHHGTSVYTIVNRYRNELKDLRRVINSDLSESNIQNYKDIE